MIVDQSCALCAKALPVSTRTWTVHRPDEFDPVDVCEPCFWTSWNKMLKNEREKLN